MGPESSRKIYEVEKIGQIEIGGFLHINPNFQNLWNFFRVRIGVRSVFEVFYAIKHIYVYGVGLFR